ncbi:hypothetical protein PYW07_014868 [Mythimna separata]|uniref:uridine/cytidine kinase n=1 Tax=Mythimna separata TaxID=271217 RepID=A0AAD8DZA9_MYTSE|nr:hypothetical protein PYW07_014868 [Mythimna separata]
MADKSTDYSTANGFESKTPFLIGVAGGTASGKSTVCQRIMEKLGQQHKEQTERRVVCISQDSFYRTLTPSERLRAERGQFNFDHPDAFDDKKLLAILKDILAGKKVEIPEYDYITNSISPNRSHTIYPADVVLIEGILVFYFPEVRELFHMKLFVDTDSDTRLARRGWRGEVSHGTVTNRSHTIYPADVVLIEGILVFYFPEVRELFHMKLFVDTDSDTRLARRGWRGEVSHGTVTNRSHTIYPADVVLIEGILVFYFPEVRELFHMKLFVDTDSDTRLARRGWRGEVSHGTVTNRSHTIYPADVVLIEGILVFYFPEVRELFHMKLFVDTDSDTRLARRGESWHCYKPLAHHLPGGRGADRGYPGVLLPRGARAVPHEALRRHRLRHQAGEESSSSTPTPTPGWRGEVSHGTVTNRSHTIYPADVVLIEGILVFYFPEVRELFHMKLFVDTDSDTRLARRGWRGEVSHGTVTNRSHTIYPADVVLIEGILVFYFPEVRELFRMKLFVDTDSDTRLARRLPRDIMERGRDLEQVLNQYMNFVKPAFEEFCLPTKKFADVIIPRGADNLVAIDLIVQHISDYLKRSPVDKTIALELGLSSQSSVPGSPQRAGKGGRPH